MKFRNGFLLALLINHCPVKASVMAPDVHPSAMLLAFGHIRSIFSGHLSSVDHWLPVLLIAHHGLMVHGDRKSSEQAAFIRAGNKESDHQPRQGLDHTTQSTVSSGGSAGGGDNGDDDWEEKDRRKAPPESAPEVDTSSILAKTLMYYIRLLEDKDLQNFATYLEENMPDAPFFFIIAYYTLPFTFTNEFTVLKPMSFENWEEFLNLLRVKCPDGETNSDYHCLAWYMSINKDQLDCFYDQYEKSGMPFPVRVSDQVFGYRYSKATGKLEKFQGEAIGTSSVFDKAD